MNRFIKRIEVNDLHRRLLQIYVSEKFPKCTLNLERDRKFSLSGFLLFFTVCPDANHLHSFTFQFG